VFRWRSYRLGRYEALQNTIDFFDSSFCANNLTLRSGFSTSHILDVLWADPALCQAGETPLECEYRRSQPTIAIIYIGLVDITYSTTDEYAENLDTILTFLIDHGVIPILNTVPSSDRMTAARGYVERMEELNRIVRDAARATAPDRSQGGHLRSAEPGLHRGRLPPLLPRGRRAQFHRR
jgi:hypothetical protein